MTFFSERDIKEILKSNNIDAEKIKRISKISGQKQVFFITVKGVEYAFKIVDVTPYEAYENIFNTDNFNFEDIKKLDKKELNEIVLQVKDECKRIYTEIKMSKACPNLPQLKFFDLVKYAFVDDYLWGAYYIEEKFDGSSLEYKKNYDDNEVLDFILQMLKQIKIMYTCGYAHRDLKPDNIIVNNGVYKVIDGGLGKNLFEEEGNSVFSCNRLGTPGYYAPEQENYPPDYKWNFQTDLYPIGIMAMEMYLPELRAKFKTLRDLDEMYSIWKEKFNKDSKTMKVFRKIITKLSAFQRLDRFNNLDIAIKRVEKLKEED